MCYAPQELKDLMAYWRAQGGTNLGIVGDQSHVGGGTSYHLGKDHLKSTAYSRRTARDKAGLTNAASAVDLGRLDGSLVSLQKFSAWFAAQCKAGKADFNDVREVIWWDAKSGHVLGWSDLSPNAYIRDYGDMSHKTHTHISFYRDSEKRDKTKMFKPYFAVTKPPPPPTTGDDMPALSASLPGYVAVVKPTANVRTSPSLKGTIIRAVTTAEGWAIIGRCKGDVDPEGGSDQWYIRWYQNRWEYTAFSNVPTTPVAPPLPAEMAKLQKDLVTVKTSLLQCNKKVTDAKAALG